MPGMACLLRAQGNRFNDTSVTKARKEVGFLQAAHALLLKESIFLFEVEDARSSLFALSWCLRAPPQDRDGGLLPLTLFERASSDGLPGAGCSFCPRRVRRQAVLEMEGQCKVVVLSVGLGVRAQGFRFPPLPFCVLERSPTSRRLPSY